MGNILFECKLSDIYNRKGYINKTSDEIIINDTIYIKAKCTSVGYKLKRLQEYKSNTNNLTFTFIGNSRIDNKPMFKINNNTGYDIILGKRYAIYEHDDEIGYDWPFMLTDIEVINEVTKYSVFKNTKFNIYMYFEL